ncbi:MAG TPA: hypothetical protein VFC42_01725 [Methylomirabilota bacterium]|nr:hypothetical protein [Methylomirabilota bacterium]
MANPAGAPARRRDPERLRVLLTNPWNGQAYCLLRALRGRAARVVATRYREHGLLGRLAPAAASRFVDAVYPVPLATDGWRRGAVEHETPREAAFVRAILDICEREAIDTVFPSWDPEVLALARHRAAFAARGITLPVADPAVLRATMDKLGIARLAAGHGVPGPRTCLPRDAGDAGELGRALGFPLVVKPRFSSGGHGSRLATTPDALARAIARLEPRYGMPIVQEWIPGGLDRRVNVYLALDRAGRLVRSGGRRNTRAVFPAFASVTAAAVSHRDPELVARLAALLRGLGYAGYATVQLKVDPRDGEAKLLEVNCRVGYRVWGEMAIGHDVAGVAIAIARGEPVAPASPAPDPVVFLNPVEDALALSVFVGGWAVRRLRRLRGAPDPGPGLRETVAAYRRDYGAPRRVVDWYFRALADDPLAALGWYAAHLVRIARLPKRGRVPGLPARGAVGWAARAGSGADPAGPAVGRATGEGSGVRG